MEKCLILLALALTACTVPAIQQRPLVIVAPVPVVAAPPPRVSIIPASIPAGPLTILDASQVAATLTADTLTISLAPNVTGTWLRLTLPGGAESGLTDNGPCHCIGLGGQGPHVLNVGFLAGLSVYTSSSLDGPWTLAATTQ